MVETEQKAKIEYQHFVYQTIETQIRHVKSVAKVFEGVSEEYCRLEEWLDVFVGMTKRNHSIQKGEQFLRFSGKKGAGGLFKRLRLVSGNKSESVESITVKRGSLVINGVKTELRISTNRVSEVWAQMVLMESVIATVYAVVKKSGYSDRPTTKIICSYLEEMGPLYEELINELDNVIFKFNSIGGEYTKNYKIFCRFQIDRRVKDPFAALGQIQFKQVYGGNRAKKIRFSRSIKKIKGVSRDDKLTRSAVRGAYLGRFENEYLKIGKEISAKSRDVLIIRQQYLVINQVITEWQLKANCSN